MPVESGGLAWALEYFAEQERWLCGECVENRGGEGDSDVDEVEMDPVNENLDSDEVIFVFFCFCFLVSVHN